MLICHTLLSLGQGCPSCFTVSKCSFPEKTLSVSEVVGMDSVNSVDYVWRAECVCCAPVQGAHLHVSSVLGTNCVTKCHSPAGAMGRV